MNSDSNSAQHSALLQACCMHSARTLHTLSHALGELSRTSYALCRARWASCVTCQIALWQNTRPPQPLGPIASPETLYDTGLNRLCRDREHLKAYRDREFSVATGPFRRTLRVLSRMRRTLVVCAGAHPSLTVATCTSCHDPRLIP